MPNKTVAFIEKANIVHDNFYDYSKVEYISLKKKVSIVCPLHGVFYQTPEKHLYAKTRCPACAGRPIITTPVFVSRALKVHGERYNYVNSKYVNDSTKLEIICNVHGSFMQAPGHHINKKQGCPLCKHDAAKERGKNNIGGYSEATISSDDIGWLYIARVDNDVDQFVKIGITKQPIKQRLRGIGGIHGYDILAKCHGHLITMYHIEQMVLDVLKCVRYRVRPNNRAAKIGWTECFAIDKQQVLIETVINKCTEAGVMLELLTQPIL